MPAGCSRVTLSRFFKNNVKLVANMCPRCYEESVDVRIISVNFVFLKQVTKNFKDLDLKEYNFLNVDYGSAEKKAGKSEYGFTKEEINKTLEYTTVINKFINVKMEHIERLEENFANDKLSRLKNVNDKYISNFTGFSSDDVTKSTKDHKKVVKACESVRYKIYKKISVRIIKNICKMRINKPPHRKLSRKITEREKTGQKQKEWKRNRHKLKENQSKYFLIAQDSNDNINIVTIKEECSKVEDNIKTEKCDHSEYNLVDPVSCSEKCTSDIKPEPETVDYEALYFKSLEDNRHLFKSENGIKIDNYHVQKKEDTDDDTTEKNLVKWIPPRSPHNLIEECLYHDPWALLVATIFLNRTRCTNARPYVFWFLKENPDPLKVLDKHPEELEKYFVKLGLQKTRAAQVWRMSHDFIYKNWKSVRELYGVGIYGEDAFKMFCLGDFSVEPKDRFLKIYKAWYEKIAAREEIT